MAERWQQWMPFHIDRFRGSPEVQAMHPAARWGYMSLLASQWQTEDCTLSPDPLDLASASGLGDDLWAQYGPRILRKFPPLDIGGRLRNDVCHIEWQAAKKVFDRNQMTPEELSELSEKRSKAGILGNEKRWGNRKVATNPSQSDRNCDKHDGKTIASDRLTGTGTYTKEQNQKTFASTANAVPAERGKFLGSLPLNDKSEYAIHEDDLQRDVGLYPAVDVKQAYRDMKGWLLADPRRCKTRRGIRKFMNSWLSREQDKGRTATQPQARGNKFDELRRKIDEGFFDEKDRDNGGTAGSAAAVG